MAQIAVWFQHRLEPMAIDRSLCCHLPARRQFPARFLRQAQNSPFVDRVQRGVKTNCWHPCALTHCSHIFCSPTTAISRSGPPSPMRHLGSEITETFVTSFVAALTHTAVGNAGGCGFGANEARAGPHENRFLSMKST